MLRNTSTCFMKHCSTLRHTAFSVLPPLVCISCATTLPARSTSTAHLAKHPRRLTSCSACIGITLAILSRHRPIHVTSESTQSAHVSPLLDRHIFNSDHLSQPTFPLCLISTPFLYHTTSQTHIPHAFKRAHLQPILCNLTHTVQLKSPHSVRSLN